MDKKERVFCISLYVSFTLLIVFVAKIIVDWNNYNPMSNSAPFWILVLTNSISYLLPSLIIFFAGISYVEWKSDEECEEDDEELV